ncbi:MAG: nitroimidazol reductase NimA-like FMN-containing flavoprotein [Candidatus Azotimanducaceae bacterium]|jgi:nitroimidazol reductase NimA-like FMN-containing flavoprotein (pyridoxamine 5'-phosphate oxidase superfamily)
MSLKMSVQERQSFLADLHVGIISIPRDNRAPLTVPIWYDYEPNGKLWVLTQPNSLKGKALQDCDYISLCVQTEAPPYQYVTVEGKFEITEPSSDQMLKMAIRYLGEERGRQYAAGSSGDNVMVSFIPENWLSVDYSKM